MTPNKLFFLHIYMHLCKKGKSFENKFKILACVCTEDLVVFKRKKKGKK